MDHEIRNVVAADGLRIDYTFNASPNGVLVVTFTERFNKQLDYPGFGTHYLTQHGFDVVAVKTNRDVWYQNLDQYHLDGILAMVELSGRHYVTRASYGSSMGAYAAIRFAKPLAIDRVLALSPLFEIKEQWDTRWKMDVPALAPTPMMSSDYVSAEADYFVVFDPCNLDLRHVERYRSVLPHGCLHTLELPFAGHPAGFFLNHVGALSAVVSTVLEQGRFPSPLPSLRTGRHRSDWYCFNLANACLARRKVRWAAQLNTQALRLKPENADYHHQLSQILQRMSDINGAIAASSRAAELSPKNLHLVAYRDMLLKQHGRLTVTAPS